jgi:MFS family permease
MEASKREPLSSWLGLIALLVVSIYALIDRQIFVLLAEPIRRDMALTDSQLGLLQGLGLALVGVITTYPISWVADRYDRRWVMAACVLVWSVAVVLSGLAPNFAVLLIGASFVGVGQAGINPAVYAIIPDLFAPPNRQLANSVFAIAVRLGGAMGLALAGLLIAGAGFARGLAPKLLGAMASWRLAFLIAAVFMPAAIAMLLSLPRRVALATRQAPGVQGPSVWGFLKQHADVQLAFFVAIAFGTFGLASIGSWVPVIAARDYGQSPVQAGAWLGAMSFITGVAGFAIGTVVMRVLQPRFDARLPMLAQAVIALTSAACSLLIGLATNVNELYGFWGLQSIFLMIEAMIMPTVLQNMTPPHLRARLFAVLSLFELVAGGLSPLAVGVLSDSLKGRPHSLMTAAVSLSFAGLVICGGILWRTARAYAPLAHAVEAVEAVEVVA